MINVKIKCNSCNHMNKVSDIDHSYNTNEEGEDYTEFNLYCSGCQIELYEGSDWGEFDLEEALEDISESDKCTIISQ